MTTFFGHTGVVGIFENKKNHKKKRGEEKMNKNRYDVLSDFEIAMNNGDSSIPKEEIKAGIERVKETMKEDDKVLDKFAFCSLMVMNNVTVVGGNDEHKAFLFEQFVMADFDLACVINGFVMGNVRLFDSVKPVIADAKYLVMFKNMDDVYRVIKYAAVCDQPQVISHIYLKYNALCPKEVEMRVWLLAYADRWIDGEMVRSKDNPKLIDVLQKLISY